MSSSLTGRRDLSPEERFARSYIPEPNSGCWLWLGNLTGSKGYGYISVNGKPTRAHRYSYEIHKGPIPDGLEIDHLCNLACCVNPDHLEPVSHQQNMARGVRTGKSKPYCIHGHPRFGENLYVFPNGDKACRECVRISVRKYQARKKNERQG